MMRKIRIPMCKPVYYHLTDDDIDYSKLNFGIYRVRISCTNKCFWRVFNHNDKHHYNHNTLKELYTFRVKYGITFELLEPDENYNYNFVHYPETVELKKLFKNWFKHMDILLKKASKGHWLVKAYVSQAWGSLTSFNKVYIKDDDVSDYDYEHLKNITTTKKYDYYCYETTNNGETHVLIPANKPYKHGGLGRIKPFLTEYCRGYMFNMISSNNLEEHVMRVATDSVCFDKPVDFPSLKLSYFPIPEAKSTGKLTFKNVNSYYHVCTVCNCTYKYNKTIAHECT
jgi:hypothetical protein